MLQNGTGFQTWPLISGGGDFPSLVQGSPTVFNMNTVPVMQDKMVNYIPGIEVTITGNVVQSGGTGVRFAYDRLYSFLIDSLEVRNAWHGSPVSPQWVKGSMGPFLEQLAGGYRPVARKRGFFPSANGTYAFSFTFVVPLSIGLGQKPHHTAQMAALFKEAQFSLQVATNTAAAAFSPGVTLTALTARASAILYPDPEIRIGPVFELVDYQYPATASQNVVPIQSFGNSTVLTRTEKGAALAALWALTSNQGLPGPFLPENVTRVMLAFRGQTDTGHVPPLVTQQLLAMGNQRSIGGAADQGAAQALSDTNGFPYAAGTDHSNSTNEMTGLLGLPLVTPGADFEVTKAQKVDGDEQIQVTVSSGLSGTWHFLAAHLRSPSEAFWGEATKYVAKLGVVDKVHGTRGKVSWNVKALRKDSDINPKKARFLPMSLKPAAKPARLQLRG